MCRYFSETKEEPLIVEVPQNSVVDNTSAGGNDNSQGNQGSHQAEEDAPQKSDMVQEVRKLFNWDLSSYYFVQVHEETVHHCSLFQSSSIVELYRPALKRFDATVLSPFPSHLY